MKHIETRMLADGLVEIPASVRERLNLKEGDRIDFYLEDEGRTVRFLARNGKLSDIKRLFKHGGPPIDVDKEIAEALGEKHDRINREWQEWDEFQEWRKAKASQAAE